MAEIVVTKESLQIRLVGLKDQFASEKEHNRGSDHAKLLRARIVRTENLLASLSETLVETVTISIDTDIGWE